jgi:hypothetical protein
MLNKQHLPILKAARDLLLERSGPICFVIDDLSHRYGIHLCRDIKRHIHEQLAPRNLMSTWLVEQVFPGMLIGDVPEPYLDGYLRERGVMTMARMAWLDRMIADIEEASC